jgi:hypothetical protein
MISIINTQNIIIIIKSIHTDDGSEEEGGAWDSDEYSMVLSNTITVSLAHTQP